MTDRKRKLPDPQATGALAVTDGQIQIGAVVRQRNEFFAFDINGKCIGVFDSMIEAARRIPAIPHTHRGTSHDHRSPAAQPPCRR